MMTENSILILFYFNRMQGQQQSGPSAATSSSSCPSEHTDDEDLDLDGCESPLRVDSPPVEGQTCLPPHPGLPSSMPLHGMGIISGNGSLDMGRMSGPPGLTAAGGGLGLPGGLGSGMLGGLTGMSVPPPPPVTSSSSTPSSDPEHSPGVLSLSSSSGGACTPPPAHSHH